MSTGWWFRHGSDGGLIFDMRVFVGRSIRDGRSHWLLHLAVDVYGRWFVLENF